MQEKTDSLQIFISSYNGKQKKEKKIEKWKHK